MVPCPKCRGKGRIVSRTVLGKIGDAFIDGPARLLACYACHGSGVVSEQTRRRIIDNRRKLDFDSAVRVAGRLLDGSPPTPPR